MIGILPNDDHLHMVERTEVKGIEDQLTGRIARRLHILLSHGCRQLYEIRFLELCAKVGFPSFFYLYIHL
jgi:hypothetical protein